MIKRFAVLMLAAATLGGVLYYVLGSRPSRKPEAPAPKLLPAPRLALPPPRPAAEPAPRHRRFLALRPDARVFAIFLLAAVFGPGSYVALADESHSPQIEHTPPESAVTRQLFAGEQRSYAAAPAPATPAGSDLPLDRRALALISPPAAPTATAAATAAPAPILEAAPPPVIELEPAPPPEPAPTPNYAYGDGFEAIICALPWPCWEAVEVAACESGRDLNGRLDGNWATNGNHFGLFQISWIHAWRWPDFYDAWMDPARNAQMAYEIWSESGWYPWSCQPWY